ncbi:hypothetical protein H2200_010487 [Cladophialophora chaetospira]|uniref:Manganese/iron superoxide dismutase C-terminal domain-containing protein n=1 Tax=Cladophialophora chaetospira TaxID=386627 RepID=A0AA38X1K2_9EURO|nr:hypothetical protein H2200_010487 [Cladophialophora chaetospira]
MITRPPTRPQSLLRAFVKQNPSKPSSVTLLPFQRRCKHSLKQWPNTNRFNFFATNGVPGFLSAETFKETYVQYCQHLANRLNDLTLGTVDESEGSFTLHAKYAHRSDKAELYNISAMLTFTQFFWEECLTEREEPEVRKPGILTSKCIQHTFGNVETLREEMLETADAMFGNGFVWLLKDRAKPDLRILATYNAGSPFKVAAPRRDDTDMATFGGGTSIADQLSGRSGMGPPSTIERDIATGSTRAGSFGDYSPNANRFHTGVLDMEPVLCLNVWQHQWIRDYGVLGKRAYLGAWWDRIDWAKAEQTVALYTQHDIFPRRGTPRSSALEAAYR